MCLVKIIYLDFHYSVIDLLTSTGGLVCWTNVKSNRPYLYWIPPDNNSLKLNIDGFSKGKHEPTGIRGVLRDHFRVVISVFSYSKGNKDSNQVELFMVVKAIELSSSMNEFIGKSFLMEFYFSSMVNWMNKPCSRPSF
jgi:hypothetical protein